MNDYNYYRISNIEITSKSKKKLLLWKYCILYDKWVCMMDMFVDTWEQRKLGEVVEFLDTMRKPLEGAKRISGPYPYYGASGIVDYVDGYLFD